MNRISEECCLVIFHAKVPTVLICVVNQTIFREFRYIYLLFNYS